MLASVTLKLICTGASSKIFLVCSLPLFLLHNCLCLLMLFYFLPSQQAVDSDLFPLNKPDLVRELSLIWGLFFQFSLISECAKNYSSPLTGLFTSHNCITSATFKATEGKRMQVGRKFFLTSAQILIPSSKVKLPNYLMLDQGYSSVL